MKDRTGQILEEVTRGIIVQQVNAQGMMGSGIAKAIREKWPKVWDEYSFFIKPKQPDQGAGHMGKVIMVHVAENLYIANIVGQQFFGRDGKRYTSYDALDVGLKQVARKARELNLPVHYPTIGCGLGGGNWTIVSSIIEANLVTIDHTLWRQPSESNDSQIQPSIT